MSTQIELDSIHEAAHCVAAVLLGVTIANVELRPGENPSGRCQFVNSKDKADEVVVVAKAGKIAEQILDPDAPGTPRRQDERIARRAVRNRLDLIFPAPRADYMRSAELEALRLVAGHLPTIQALAQQLLEKGKMLGPEATAFVRRQLSISGQPDSATKPTA